MFEFGGDDFFVFFDVSEEIDGGKEVIFAELLEGGRFAVVEKGVKD